MASLSKREFADYVWNNGILPLLSNTKIENRSAAYKLTNAQVASTSFTQTKGGWNYTSGSFVHGPAGYAADKGHEQWYAGNGAPIRADTDHFGQYTYTSNTIPDDPAPISCTIYACTGVSSSNKYGNSSYSPKMVVSTNNYPAVNTSTAYTAYINYLTALGLFSTSYNLGSVRS